MLLIGVILSAGCGWCGGEYSRFDRSVCWMRTPQSSRCDGRARRLLNQPSSPVRITPMGTSLSSPLSRVPPRLVPKVASPNRSTFWIPGWIASNTNGPLTFQCACQMCSSVGRPIQASFAGGAGARPHHSINQQTSAQSADFGSSCCPKPPPLSRNRSDIPRLWRVSSRARKRSK